MLLKWNQRINLTAVRSRDEIATRHFGESLFVGQKLFPDSSELAPVPHLIDVGSGPGFPGLPIKIWAAEIRLTLIESSQKKATFLREVIRALAMKDVEVFSGRAEDYPKTSADVVTLRAVERFESILTIAASLAKLDGRLALLIGRTQIAAASKTLPHVSFASPIPLPTSKSRVVLLGKLGSRSSEPKQ